MPLSVPTASLVVNKVIILKHSDTINLRKQEWCQILDFFTTVFTQLALKVCQEYKRALALVTVSVSQCHKLIHQLRTYYRPRSEGDNVLGCVRPSVCPLPLSRHHYQSKVIVCVSVISRRRRIIARMRSIGVLIHLIDLQRCAIVDQLLIYHLGVDH